jgi:hypothetical protein
MASSDQLLRVTFVDDSASAVAELDSEQRREPFPASSRVFPSRVAPFMGRIRVRRCMPHIPGNLAPHGERHILSVSW